MIDKKSLIKELRMDLSAMGGNPVKNFLFTVEFWLIFSYRIQHRLVKWPRPFRWLVMPIRMITQIFTGCFIHWDAEIEGGIRIIHATGICIGITKIGAGTIIFQNVTIGLKSLENVEFPTIGRNVTIYAGAVIVGNIQIGDSATIAANAVVLKNVDSGNIVGGIPARLLSNKE